MRGDDAYVHLFLVLWILRSSHGGYHTSAFRGSWRAHSERIRLGTAMRNEECEGDEEEEEEIQAYGSRSLSWTKKYRELFPYEYARRRVLSLGLQSKADWDEYVADGKRGNGAYLPNQPDLMYAPEWQGWDEFLGVLRTYTETQYMVQHVLKIRSRLTYELFIYQQPKRAELLRIPALPWIVYENRGWINDEHFFGCRGEEELNEPLDLS
jgi:hypothetical protein